MSVFDTYGWPCSWFVTVTSSANIMSCKRYLLSSWLANPSLVLEAWLAWSFSCNKLPDLEGVEFQQPHDNHNNRVRRKDSHLWPLSSLPCNTGTRICFHDISLFRNGFFILLSKIEIWYKKLKSNLTESSALANDGWWGSKSQIKRDIKRIIRVLVEYIIR